SMAPRTMAILSAERAMSVASKAIGGSLRAAQRRLAIARLERGFDAAEDLVVGERLSFRRISSEDFLLAILKVDERSFFFSVNGRGEHDVRDLGERMRRIPRMNDEEFRFAKIGDDRGIFRARTEFGVADVEDVDAVGAFRQKIVR